MLEVAAGADLIAKKVLGGAHHPLAQNPGVSVRFPHCKIMESLRKFQRCAVPTPPGVTEIEAVKSAQLILRVLKACRDVEFLRERSFHIGSLGCRFAQRVMQSHRLARVRSGSEGAKRLPCATAT